MRIAVFFTDSIWSGWNVGHGTVDTLKRMGHDAVSCAIPAVNQIAKADFEELRRRLPSVGQLREFDAILIDGIEYLTGWFQNLYGDEWFKLQVPRMGWTHESNDRDDRRHAYETLTRWADFWFYRAWQDAETLNGTWLPSGFDAKVFRPADPAAEKRYPFGFIGLLYEKRKWFLQELLPKLGPEIVIACGNVRIEDLGGFKPRQTALLYAQNIREIRVFVNLPTLARLSVGKVYEVTGCGTCMVMQRPQGPPENAHIQNVFYYDTADECAGILQQLKNKPGEVDAMANRGCLEAHSAHTLRHRMEKMLLTVFRVEEHNGTDELSAATPR